MPTCYIWKLNGKDIVLIQKRGKNNSLWSWLLPGSLSKQHALGTKCQSHKKPGRTPFLGCMKGPAAAAARSLQSCLTLCDPIDGSPPGSPIPGILQARTLDSPCHFLLQCMKSEKWKWSLSVVSDSSRPHGLAYQAPLSMGFSRQEYWSGSPLPSPHESCSTSQEVRPLGIHFSQETVRMQISNTDLWEHCETRKQKRIGGLRAGKASGASCGGGSLPLPQSSCGKPPAPARFAVLSLLFLFLPGPCTLPAPPVRPLGGLALVSCPVLWNKGFLAHGLSKSSSWDSISICLLPSA